MYTHELIASPFKPSVGSAAAGNTALNGQEMALEREREREREREHESERERERVREREREREKDVKESPERTEKYTVCV